MSTSNPNKPGRKAKLKICKKCNLNTVSTNKREFCESCRKEKYSLGRGDLTLKQAIYSHQHKSQAFNLIRSRSRTIGLKLFKCCIKCGYDKHIEICHIKAISDFELDVLISEINHPSNLIALCPNCHWEFDHPT